MCNMCSNSMTFVLSCKGKREGFHRKKGEGRGEGKLRRYGVGVREKELEGGVLWDYIRVFQD